MGQWLTQCGQQIGFFSVGVRDVSAESVLYFRFLQYIEHLCDAQCRVLVYPAQFEQGCSGPFDVTDFRITEFARPKMLAFAHHQSDPQSL